MTFLVGCGAGFSGDRTDGAVPVVRTLRARGAPAALIFETLAERTLAIGHVARRQDPERGYEPMLDAFLEPVLRPCVEAGIVIVGNFGVANPRAAAKRVRALATEAGLPEVRIAVVEGDDVLDELPADAWLPFEGETLLDPAATPPLLANVYLGAEPIARAIRAGAQVVVTGRVADPALTLGPLVAHYDWAWDDWDRLAAGALAGHLIECAAQVTGGYFADPGLKEVPDLAHVGFPIVEVAEDGSCVVTKADATGGRVSLRTVKEQLLYEMHDPAAYVTPDVVLDVTRVSLREVGPHRVAVTGARGHPAPPTLKATVAIAGDWLGEAEISYAGPNALARGELAAHVVRQRLHDLGSTVRRRIDLVGTVAAFDGDDGGLLRRFGGAPDEVRLRLAVAGPDRTAVERALREVLSLYLNGPAGGGGVRSRVEHRLNTVSCLVPRERVAPRFAFLEELNP